MNIFVFNTKQMRSTLAMAKKINKDFILSIFLQRLRVRKYKNNSNIVTNIYLFLLLQALNGVLFSLHQCFCLHFIVSLQVSLQVIKFLMEFWLFFQPHLRYFNVFKMMQLEKEDKFRNNGLRAENKHTSVWIIKTFAFIAASICASTSLLYAASLDWNENIWSLLKCSYSLSIVFIFSTANDKQILNLCCCFFLIIIIHIDNASSYQEILHSLWSSEHLHCGVDWEHYGMSDVSKGWIGSLLTGVKHVKARTLEIGAKHVKEYLTNLCCFLYMPVSYKNV